MLSCLLVVLVSGVGCQSALSSPTPSRGAVALVFSLEPGIFVDGATVTVQVWSAADLAALQSNARCASVSAPGGGPSIRCPPGVVYRDVAPERFTVPVSAARATAEVTAQRVTGGEMFRINLSGMSRDGCNTTFADLTRIATPGRTMLGELAWQTTARACPGATPGPDR